MKHAPTPALRRLLCWAAALLLTAAALCLWAVRSDLADRPDQQAAARWSADEASFAQVSLYLPEKDALDTEALLRARAALDSALTQASLEPANENARLWLDAASAELTGAAATDRGTANVAITAVNGDYFHFHPLQLKSGSTFSPADERQDTIVLDELTAWQLFGSSDVTGRPVTLNGALYYVCGVAAMPQDSAAVLTYGERPRVWIFAESLPEAPALVWYEAVLPEPYTGHALQLVEDAFGTGERDCVLLENSTRYRPAGLWKTLKALPRASMRTDGIAYPWWENAAVWQQTRAALLLAAQLLCLVWPALLLLLTLWRLWRRRRWHLRDIGRLIERAVDRRRTARWDAATHPDAFSPATDTIAVPAAMPTETPKEDTP